MNWENKMGKAYLYAIKKRKCPKKIRTLKKYPTIQRSDVMNCILSEYATSEEKNLLSCMYYEITKMEKEIPPPDSKHLDGKRTIVHTRLANKYMPRIQKITDGN